MCLDGSPAVFYLWQPPTPSTKYIVFLEGGGWCYGMTDDATLADCVSRANTTLGSSTTYPPTYQPSYEGGNGLLSNDSTINPTTYDFNMVYARYCDGASFAGDVAAPVNVNGTTIYFRGHRILHAIWNTLVTSYGLGSATEAVLAGCSAGGLATYVHCDEFSAFVTQTVTSRGLPAPKTRCVSDAGYFPDYVALPSGVPVLRTQYQSVVRVQNTTGGVNAACVAGTAPADQWQCFFPQYTAPFLKTPIFALNSDVDSWQLEADWFAQAAPGTPWETCAKNIDDCTGPQLAAVQNFSATYVSETLSPILSPESPHGAFISSCFEHCQSGVTWQQGAKIGGRTIGAVFDDWYRQTEPSAATKAVMCPYPCSEAGSSC